MAAFIPSRRDAEVNERALAKVREDKEREAGRRVRRLVGGASGPGAASAGRCSTRVLGERPTSSTAGARTSGDSAEQLLDVAAIPGRADRGRVAGQRRRRRSAISRRGCGGNGAVGIHNLMEDAATAEISRSQIWQWIRARSGWTPARRSPAELVRRMIDEELASVRQEIGPDAYAAGRFEQARELFERVALGDDFVDFLTLPAYETVLTMERATE